MKKSNTVLMRSAYRRYGLSDIDDIYKAYGRPSSSKVHAWDRCKKMCEKYDGYGLRIIGKNCNYFSVGFIGTVDGKKAFVFITADNDRYMYL